MRHSAVVAALESKSLDVEAWPSDATHRCGVPAQTHRRSGGSPLPRKVHGSVGKNVRVDGVMAGRGGSRDDRGGGAGGQAGVRPVHPASLGGYGDSTIRCRGVGRVPVRTYLVRLTAAGNRLTLANDLLFGGCQCSG